MRNPNLQPIDRRLLDYLPQYYRENAIVTNILGKEGVELQQVSDEIQDVLNQFFVETATWGLPRWEAICGIHSSKSLELDERRSLVKGRLRGFGTSTVALIQTVSESFLNGECVVEELNDTYEVRITFVGKRGTPKNMMEIERTINEIIPAHLKATFVVTFLTWREMTNKGIRWQDATTKEDGSPRTWEELITSFI